MSQGVEPSASAPPHRQGWWRSWRNLLKLAYSLAAAIFSVWFVSFTPIDGPPLTPFVPKSAALLLHVRSGNELLMRLQSHPALQELLQDPDINALLKPQQHRDEVLAAWQKAPGIVQWLVPPTREGVYPFTGRELAIVALGPGKQNDPQAQTEAPYTQADAKRPAALIFTRLSGGVGQLARLAATYARISKRVSFFDLGGDLVAFGINGAQPEFSRSSPPFPGEATTGHAAIPDARLTLWPANMQAARKPLDIDVSPQLEMLQAEGVPEKVLRALLKPPSAAEMLNLNTLPAEITLDLNFTIEGGLVAQGRIEGMALPPLPLGASPGQSQSAFAEAVLPLDPQSCFLKYLEGNMRLKKNAARLSSGQRRWAERLATLQDNEIDLDRDLWPALGKLISFRIQESPQNLNYTSYGLITGSLPFDGNRAEARKAAGELARERWDYLFDGAPETGVKPPYVRRFRQGRVERYVLRTTQVTVPSWAVDDTSVSFVSDAGPFALREGALPPDLPPPPSLMNDSGEAPRYFLRLNGERLAPTTEAGATNYFDALEEDIGPGEFLAQYPNAPLRIQVIKKLTRVLGKFYLEVKPEANSAASIKLTWTPGKLAAQDAKSEEDVAPPPPPAL